MNNFGRSYTAASSRATPQTLCQKCLKRDKLLYTDIRQLVLTSKARHYSYECKGSAQDRPYVPRPSRSQQLANPKLKPKLASDAPNELLRKSGIADEELAKKEAERGRKRKIDEVNHVNGSRKRSRSVSSYSSASVSTISTSISSPKEAGAAHTGQSQMMAGLEMERKRRRSPSSSMSYSSRSPVGRRHRQDSRERNGRQKRPEYSPYRKDTRGTLGRYSGRQPTPPEPRRHRSRSRSSSLASDSSYDQKGRRRSDSVDRGKRRRRSFRSPDDRGRNRDAYAKRGSRETRSPSRDRSQVMRNRKSMTPGVPSRAKDGYGQHRRPSFDRRSSYNEDNERYGSSARTRDENTRSTTHHPPPRKERSLSPFSKRLALTQAMNMGH